MAKVCLDYLFSDKAIDPNYAISDYDTFNILSEGSNIYGQCMWPDGSFNKRPCVVLLHGFPGVARNDDLAHALCRIGCVVITPHHRGAWSSEGKYLPSNCIEDAINIIKHVRTEEFCSKYRIDLDAIFLAGHSMGGNTTVNAAKILPELRGIVLITPFDPTRSILDGEPQLLKAILSDYIPLNCDGVDALYEDIETHLQQWRYDTSAKQLRGQNICCLTGDFDPAVPNSMVEPFWTALEAESSDALHLWKKLPASHGLLGCRCETIRIIASFIQEVLSR